jgi:hypothetical protein
MPLPVAIFACCRDHDLFWPMGDHAEAIQRGPVDEAYWLNWMSECRGRLQRCNPHRSRNRPGAVQQ